MALHAADMRKDYALGGLEEEDLDADPIRQFARWFAEAQAAEVAEPNAMTVATASASSPPMSLTPTRFVCARLSTMLLMAAPSEEQRRLILAAAPPTLPAPAARQPRRSGVCIQCV